MTETGIIKRPGIFLLMGIIGILLGSLVVMAGLRTQSPVLVCFGDSLTSCGGRGGHYSHWLAHALPDVMVVDAGIGGDTLTGGRGRYKKDVLSQNPDLLIIALGANDFWRNERPVQAMHDDLEYMVSQARKRKIEVVIASCFGKRDFWREPCVEFNDIYYSLAHEIAAMEQTVCQQYNCIYLPNMQLDIKPNRLAPFWDETDHPNSSGNQEVALRLLPYVKQALARKKGVPKRRKI